ncbi:hypothetical protein [Natronoarchaeum rubrum]|uniref:hypothetical protein n=1 Tax=Natronoarchaeum rubrum TaxID=755311 RepID=UPI002111E587|nr:hypothetical protein [Natronoarchaeum rubrum]
MTDRSRIVRYAGIALLVGALVVTAGCTSALDGGGPSDGNETAPTENESAVNETDTESSDGDDQESGDGHDHGDGDGHDHGGADSDEGENSSSASASGRMTTVVAGTELSPQPSDDAAIQFAESDDTWQLDESGVTVASALSQAYGVDVTADAVTHDGTTYHDGDGGTSVHVRVNGEPVDPTSRELSDGDQVWLTVETDEMDVDVPGEYIPPEDQHIHGDIEFVVEGEEIDFSADRYQSGHQHFHFEGGAADPWHAHSWSVSLGYAMSTLDGIDVTDGEVTYDGTTYTDEEVTVEVNGESVDPDEYFLKDGDSVRIVAGGT